MQFATIIKNNESTSKRLIWLQGRTVEANGHIVVDKCLPAQLAAPEAKAMLNEMHGGAITVAYVTDVPTVSCDKLDDFLKTLTAPATPIVEESVPVVTKDVNSDLRDRMERELKKTTKIAEEKKQVLGKVEVDAKKDDDKLASALAVEGSMDDFLPSRTAFTEADKEAVESLPAITEAFTEPENKVQDKFTKSAQTLFDVADADKPRRKSRKDS